MSELKPCPFCGGNAALHFAGDKLWVPVYWVKCVECSAESEVSSTEFGAIKNWNRRANDEAD